MRQYLVVIVGIVVLGLAFFARSYVNKTAPAQTSGDALLRAGQELGEGLAKAKPAEYGSLEPRFAALHEACKGAGAAAPAAKQLCERAGVLHAAVKAGTATPEGAQEVQAAVAALAGAPGK
jgi:hypothetical protein